MESEKFVLTKEALETHLSFLQEKEPSIIGKTCQMLSSLKIVNMPPNEALPFVIGVIDAMKEEGKRLPGLTKEQWSDLRLDSLEKYLPKILKERKWVYSIENYIIDKLMNSLTVEARRQRRYVPLFIVREDGEGNKELIENPKIHGRFDEKRIECLTEINHIFEKAKLTDREINVYSFKNITPYTESLIGDVLGVSRDTVKKDYSKTKVKIRKTLQ